MGYIGEGGNEMASGSAEDIGENAAEFDIKFDPSTLLHHLNSAEGKA